MWSFIFYPMVVAMGFNCLKRCDCWHNDEDGTRNCFLKYD